MLFILPDYKIISLQTVISRNKSVQNVCTICILYSYVVAFTDKFSQNMWSWKITMVIIIISSFPYSVWFSLCNIMYLLKKKELPYSFRKWRLKCLALSMTPSCILLIFYGVCTPGSQKYPFEISKLPYFMPYKIPECIRYTRLISSDAAVMASAWVMVWGEYCMTNLSYNSFSNHSGIFVWNSCDVE